VREISIPKLRGPFEDKDVSGMPEIGARILIFSKTLPVLSGAATGRTRRISLAHYIRSSWWNNGLLSIMHACECGRDMRGAVRKI